MEMGHRVVGSAPGTFVEDDRGRMLEICPFLRIQCR